MADTEQKTPRNRTITWILTTIGSFVATALGLALTVGVSKLNERQAEKELQKQCVFNVLTDIDNVIMFSRKDSTTISELGKWLPSCVESYATGKKFPVDTAALEIWQLTGSPSYLRLHYKTIGPDIVNNIAPVDARDMMLHRLFGLAYSSIDRLQMVTRELDGHMDHALGIIVTLNYSKKEYEDRAIVDIFFKDPDFLMLCNTVDQLERSGGMGYYIRGLENMKKRILNYSGITEEEYLSFMDANSTTGTGK